MTDAQTGQPTPASNWKITHRDEDHIEVDTGPHTTVQQAEAYARLIAGAPALLKALQRINTIIEDSDEWWMATRFEEAGIDAAIAKATNAGDWPMAETATYAPGPWECRNCSGQAVAITVDNDEQDEQDEQDEANARLIAAAPETKKQRDALLEALQLCIGVLTPIVEAGADKGTQTAFLLGSDAIAQATT